MKIRFVLIIAIVLVATIFIIFINKSIGSLSYEKCQETNNNDCWHSLAHQTLNSTYCNKIKDNETREHCLEHIPK